MLLARKGVANVGRLQAAWRVFLLDCCLGVDSNDEINEESCWSFCRARQNVEKIRRVFGA